MINKRPLIFLYPLSVSNKKYFDFLSEIDEEEREFELYEVDMLAEAAQLVASVGPSIMLCSNVKKCAKVLQENKSQLKKSSSKVILINEKEVPNNVFRKLQKMGLTDLLQEPVAQKTLEYKMNILINGLPKVQGFNEIVEEVEEEEEVVVFKKEKREEIETETKQRVEKGIITEKDTAPEPEVSKNSTDLSLFETTNDDANKVLTDSDLSLFEKEENENEEIDTDSNISSYIKTVSTHSELNINFDKDNKTPEESEEKPEEDEVDLEKKTHQEIEISKSSNKTEESSEKQEEKSSTEIINSSIDLSIEFEKDDKEGKEQNDDKQDDLENEDLQEKIELDAALEKDILDIEASNDDDRSELIDDLSDSLNLQSSGISQEASDNKRAEEESKDEHDNGFELEHSEPSKSEDELHEDLALDNYTNEEKNSDEINTDDKAVITDSSMSLIKPSERQAIEDQKKADDLLESDDMDDQSLKLDSIKDKENNEDENKDSDQLEVKDLSSNEIKLNSSQNDSDYANEDEDTGLKLKKLEQNELDISAADSEVKKLENTSKEENELKTMDLNLLDGKENEDDVTTLDIEGHKKDEQQEILSSKAEKLKITNQAELVLAAAEKKKKKEQEIEYADWGIGSGKKVQERYDDWVSKRKILDEVSFDVEKRGEVEIDYGDLYKQYKEVTIEQLQSLDENSGGVSKEGEDDDSIDNSEVIEPKSKGVEHVIKALMMYYNKAEEKQILNYIANLVYKDFKGQVAFFEEKKDSEATETYSAVHNIIYSGNREELIEGWEEYKETNRFDWSIANLPVWSDTKYIEEENNFVYPFYEGITKLGFAVIFFPQNIKKEDSSKLEMIIESARAIFLEHVKEAPKNLISKTSEDKTENTKEGNKKSFFGKLFGK